MHCMYLVAWSGLQKISFVSGLLGGAENAGVDNAASSNIRGVIRISS